jgi:hypothetical protein
MTAHDAKDFSAPDTIKAWQCIGCGRLEAPANCVGICQDRKVELVGARDYAEVVFVLEEANGRIAELESVLRRLVHITPREGTLKDSYLAMQAHARKVLQQRESESKQTV